MGEDGPIGGRNKTQLYNSSVTSSFVVIFSISGSTMDDAPTSMPRAPIVRMGIRGLSDLSSSMLGGGVYVLIAKTTSARFPLLASSIASALEDGVASAVVVSANPAQFVQRIEVLADIDTASLMAEQRLQLFFLQDNFLKKMFQFGASRFVSELEDFGIPENSYLIFDQADELLSLHDVSLAHEQVTVLKEGLAKRGITALLVFSRLTDAHSSTINAIMDSLDGIVRLGSEKDGLVLSFDYWQSPSSVTVAKNYQLVTLDTGLYEASAHSGVMAAVVREDNFPPPMLIRSYPPNEMAPMTPARPASPRLDRYRGYLKPLSFLQELERILEQSEPGSVPCTVVIGIPARGMGMSDIIKRFDRSARLGELISADDQHCYISLNTDSRALALENLQIILGMSVAAVFTQSQVLSDHDAIRHGLGGLLQASKRSDCPDFSSIHDVAQPLNASGAGRPRDVHQASNHPRGASASASIVTPQGDEPLRHAGRVELLDFEPARRSSTPYTRIFDRSDTTNVSNIHFTSHTDRVDDIVFDVEESFHGPVFGKTEAPRAKRSLN